MPIQFLNGEILFDGGAIAFDPNCCCEDPSLCCWVNPDAPVLELTPAADSIRDYSFGGKELCPCIANLENDHFLLNKGQAGGLASGCTAIDNFWMDPVVGVILGYWSYVEPGWCTLAKNGDPGFGGTGDCPPNDGFDYDLYLQILLYHKVVDPIDICYAIAHVGLYCPTAPTVTCWYGFFEPIATLVTGGAITQASCESALGRRQLIMDRDKSVIEFNGCNGCRWNAPEGGNDPGVWIGWPGTTP